MPIDPLDPRTLLLGLQPQARVPYDAPDVVAERRAHVEQLREAAKAKQQKEYEAQVYDWAIKSNLGPDGQPDMPRVAKALYSVNGTFGDHFMTALRAAQKETAQTKDAELLAQQKQIDVFSRTLHDATPDNWGSLRPILQNIHPQLGALLPEQYDQDAIVKAGRVGESATEFNTNNREALKLYGTGDVQQAIARSFNAYTQPLTDSDVASVLKTAQEHGAGVDDVKPWLDKKTEDIQPYAHKLLIPAATADQLAQTKAHDKALEDQAAATLANTQTNQAQIEAREQQRIRLEADGQQNTEKYRANELALQRLRLGQDAVDKATSAGYNVSKNRLDTLRKPLADVQARMSRLVDTVNQGTPQADALIAPELMTVMAGGMGSGLRINEAEITRVLGGRSNLEGIKAALNKWQTDPTQALSVTPAQRQQIRSLIQAVGEKADAKMKVIQQADDDLLDAKSVDEQRRIIVKAQKEVEGIGGTAAPTAGAGTTSRHYVGEKVTLRNGKTITISAVHPDGSFEGQ